MNDKVCETMYKKLVGHV